MKHDKSIFYVVGAEGKRYFFRPGCFVFHNAKHRPDQPCHALRADRCRFLIKRRGNEAKNACKLRVKPDRNQSHLKVQRPHLVDGVSHNPKQVNQANRDMGLKGGRDGLWVDLLRQRKHDMLVTCSLCCSSKYDVMDPSLASLSCGQAGGFMVSKPSVFFCA